MESPRFCPSDRCEPEAKQAINGQIGKQSKKVLRANVDDEPSVGSLFNCYVRREDSNNDILSPKFDPSLFDISPYYSVKSGSSKGSGSFLFSFLADVLQKSDDIFCSGKGSRKSVLTLLSNFFRVLIFYNPSDLIPAVYILQNRICPEYESTELGVGDSLIIKSMAEAYSKSDKTIKALVAKHEDLGMVASLSSCTSQTIVKLPDLTISGIFSQFRSIADMVGKNSINRKRDIIKKLLISAKKSEAKYIVRYLQQKLRIGIGINTIFQCIADAFYLTRPAKGDSSAIGDVRIADLNLDYTLEDMEVSVRTAITNVPCIDKVVGCLLNGDTAHDLKEHCKITPGIPLRPMLAKPVNTTHEIIQSIGSDGVTFTCEYKYDGERVQIHMVDQETVTLFSRNMENLSEKYPDVIDKFLKSVKPGLTSCILDCEIVAFDGEKILPFQNLSTRKRKDVDLDNITVHVCLFPFDILYCNGEPLVTLPLNKRRESMRDWLIQKEGVLMFANHKDMDSLDEIDDFLRLAVADSCEGLMIKSLDDGATYEPQKRSNKWLKFKKDYIAGMSDSVDLVPIAAFYGKGKRTNVYGSYLLAIYDPVQEIFQGVCKTGTGFTDQTLKYLYDTLQQHIIPSKLPTYEVSDKLEPDVWFMPEKVWECKAADLSISPVYTAANRLTANGKGIGLRFPRFLRDRDDKKAIDATTSEQIHDMFNSQFNKP
ncbi:ATP-dependent DNA ligase domain containing protein [Theileria equi strain WA]|uniref:DNA ligase n=1 Tax=Theileria equi strain WA TaxID=1537102 RepID=L1LBZ1_THEEQ|nr:ATP-dependent DNA ligase domain containing protein [Theileria equi strain WA]EKX72693.1 ATP-dependent DNA ligase domain containing protein [Theileria equi strain WA]|eukprot:XP_004832145.1 ATP-dependent DNA ligase domain containing protein [Theileria equi strain WA]